MELDRSQKEPSTPLLFPLHEQRAALESHCRMPLHSGRALVGTVGNLRGEVILPASGDCILALSGAGGSIPSRGIHESLRIEGECEDGHFVLTCPVFAVNATSPINANPAWALASPINRPMVIEYGSAAKPIAKLVADVENFDFEYGNVPVSGPHRSRSMDPNLLRVEAAGRNVEFTARADRSVLRNLVASKVLRNASFTQFSFANWPGSSESELVDFAYDVATLCNYIIQQHAGVPLVTLLDEDARPSKRIIRSTIQSEFRRDYIFAGQVPDGIPRLFSECFHEHVKMRMAGSRWRKLPAYVAGISDPSYLEQKFASLMMAIEFLMKNSLMESHAPPSAEEVEAMQLQKLISCCRGLLRWDIPKHYTSGDVVRLLRNAVMHGGELPTRDSAAFRHAFDKWRLFLMRRVLLRLGYTGTVYSPQNRWAASSPVGDFSESHNSYG